MHRQTHSLAREQIVAESIKEVVSELRMVDAADYIVWRRSISTPAALVTVPEPTMGVAGACILWIAATTRYAARR